MIRRSIATALAVGATATPSMAQDVLVGSYWSGFRDFWVGAVQRQNGVILGMVGFGLVCIFIITRTKAKK